MDQSAYGLNTMPTKFCTLLQKRLLTDDLAKCCMAQTAWLVFFTRFDLPSPPVSVGIAQTGWFHLVFV